MRDWTGPTAFVLALGVSIGFAGTMIVIAGPWKNTDPLGTAAGYILSALGGAMIGAVAAYLGGFGRKNRRR